MIKNKSFLITILTVVIPMLLQFIYIRYVSYNVDKEVYGNFILLQTLIVALSYIFLQIPSQAYDRFYNEVKDRVNFVNEFRTTLIFVNIISIIIISIYGYMMQKFSFEVLFLIYLYFLLLNNYSFNQKVFLLNLERKKYFYLKTLEAIAKFLMPIFFYIYFHTLEAFLGGIVFGYLISFLILMKFMKNYPFKININWYNYKKYFLFAYPIIFVSIFSWGISFSDRYFIEYLSGTKDVAIYAILAQVAGIGQIIGQIYSMYVNPKVLKMYEEDKNKGINYLNNMLKKLFVVFVLLTIVAYFIPYQVYAILIEKSLIIQEYYFWTFLILVIGIFLTVFQTAMSMHLTLAKKLHILAYINGVAFFVNIIGNLWIKEYGIIAAAVSTLLAYIVLNVGLMISIRMNR
jgi:O-antigen/teichoic acid export membrane protein